MHAKTAWRAAAFVWLGAVCCALHVSAQTATAPAAPTTSTAATTPPAPTVPEVAATAAADRGEPAVKYTIIEDEGSRIDELRVRGETQHITVTPKAGGKPLRPYEIITSAGSQSLQEAPNGVRGAAGKRVWHVLSF